MGTAENRRTIESYFEAVNSGEKDAILKLLTDDFVFKGMGRHPDWMRYTWGREPFAEAPRVMSGRMKKPITMRILGMIAEGDKVAVQADSYGEMSNGKIYDNAYHFVFTIRDGKISEVLEYCCTYTAVEVFAEYVNADARTLSA